MFSSLLAEITGAIPATEATEISDIAGEAPALIVFGNPTNESVTAQNDALRPGQNDLRQLSITVVHVPDGDGPVSLNGLPCSLAADRIRTGLNREALEQFQVMLLDSDGRLLLRSDKPVPLDQLREAIRVVGRTGGNQ
jgi:hypothetical protein